MQLGRQGFNPKKAAGLYRMIEMALGAFPGVDAAFQTAVPLDDIALPFDNERRRE